MPTRAARGQAIGDGTPIHLTIPTDNPWVPLRILALGKTAAETVQADVYLLTDERPALLPNAGAFGESAGLILDHSDAASDGLLADLRSDAGMEWVPADAWLTKVVIDSKADELNFDLAIDASGAGKPSPIDAGFAPFRPTPVPRSPIALYLGLATMLVVAVPIGPRASDARWLRPPTAGRRMSRLPRLAVAALLLAATVTAWLRRPRPDDGDDHDPLLGLRPHRGQRPARRAGDVRPRQRGPDRPRMADRRRGVPREAPDRDPRVARRRSERGDDPRARDDAHDPHLRRTGDAPIHLPPAGHEAYGMVGTVTVEG
jgi:hypothetical protein